MSMYIIKTLIKIYIEFMFLRIKSIYRFCDKSTNYHKATGALPGRSNVEIK